MTNKFELHNREEIKEIFSNPKFLKALDRFENQLHEYEKMHEFNSDISKFQL